jgi:hypothetical protein
MENPPVSSLLNILEWHTTEEVMSGRGKCKTKTVTSKMTHEIEPLEIAL